MLPNGIREGFGFRFRRPAKAGFQIAPRFFRQRTDRVWVSYDGPETFRRFGDITVEVRRAFEHLCDGRARGPHSIDEFGTVDHPISICEILSADALGLARLGVGLDRQGVEVGGAGFVVNVGASLLYGPVGKGLEFGTVQFERALRVCVAILAGASHRRVRQDRLQGVHEFVGSHMHLNRITGKP